MLCTHSVPQQQLTEREKAELEQKMDEKDKRTLFETASDRPSIAQSMGGRVFVFVNDTSFLLLVQYSASFLSINIMNNTHNPL